MPTICLNSILIQSQSLDSDYQTTRLRYQGLWAPNNIRQPLRSHHDPVNWLLLYPRTAQLIPVLTVYPRTDNTGPYLLPDTSTFLQNCTSYPISSTALQLQTSQSGQDKLGILIFLNNSVISQIFSIKSKISWKLGQSGESPILTPGIELITSTIILTKLHIRITIKPITIIIKESCPQRPTNEM